MISNYATGDAKLISPTTPKANAPAYQPASDLLRKPAHPLRTSTPQSSLEDIFRQPDDLGVIT